MNTPFRLLPLVALVLPLFAGAQNLVVNPSFETVTSCPLGTSELDKAAPWRDPFLNLVGDTCSTSDLYNACSPFGAFGVGVPNNILGSQPARTGDGYAGIIVYEGFALLGCQTLFGSGWREYLHGTLTQPMVAGQTYCVEFHVSLADNVKFSSPNIGVHFSTVPLNVSCATIGGSSVLPVTPQLEYTGPEVTDTEQWQRLQWNYTATGGEQYITIGNFQADATTTYNCANESALNPYAYYFVDDVSVVPEPCCNAEFAPVAPLCATDAPVLLQPTTPGGTWSGPGISAPNAGAFDPALAGPGLHSVVHTLPCGSDTLVIAVSNCAPLEVCIGADGSWNVINGLSPYTWQQQTTTQDCSDCLFGCFFPPGCAVNVTTWSDFATGASILPPATLPVRVVDAAGSTLEIASPAGLAPCPNCPDITLSVVQSTNVACNGASTGSASVQATGGTGPYTFSWSPGALQGPQQIGLAAGNYTVTATDADGCTGNFQVLIAQPPPLSVTITGTTPTTCGGADGTATVQASGGTAPYTQLWSPAGGTALTATGLAEGSYQVTITDASGCTALANTTIQPEPTQAEITGPDALCTGDSIVLTASGGSSYLWSTGATTSSITVTAGGTYTVEVSGCGSDQASVTVVETTVVADIGGDPLVGDPPLEVLFTNTSTPPGATFLWDLGDGTAFTGTTTDHIYTDPGIYTVVMTATANGCNDSDTLLVVVNSPVVVSDIFVPNVFTPNGDGQNDAWGVESVGLSSLNAQVFNRWGQLVAELRAPDRSWDGRTEASQPAPEGTYYYVLQAEGADGRSYRFTGSLTLLR